MLRADLAWISCPACDAGSPAGVSICPRCRGQLPTPDGRAEAWATPKPPAGRTLAAPWVLRGLVFAQIASSAIVAVWARSGAPAAGIGGLSPATFAAFFFALVALGPGVILPVLLLTRDCRLPPWKKLIIVGVEAEMCLAYLLVLIPTAQ